MHDILDTGDSVANATKHAMIPVALSEPVLHFGSLQCYTPCPGCGWNDLSLDRSATDHERLPFPHHKSPARSIPIFIRFRKLEIKVPEQFCQYEAHLGIRKAVRMSARSIGTVESSTYFLPTQPRGPCISKIGWSAGSTIRCVSFQSLRP